MAHDNEPDQEEFTYDVAFSFLAEDEDLATELDDNLKSRLSTFIYSRKQEELAGKDGEEAFNSVFAKEARIVVVLFRSGWGTSPFTRIEQTAIRNRAFDDGYDFALFINCDSGAKLPPWLPKNKLWFGFEQYGLNGALSVIEARVQEAGGVTRPETFEERTTRVAAEIQAEGSRKSFLASTDGVSAARSEFEALAKALTEKVEFARDSGGIDIAIGQEGLSVGMACKAGGEVVSLAIDWRCQYANSLADSYLAFELWNGPPPNVGDSHVWDKPTQRSQTKFEFDRHLNEYGWSESGADGVFRTSEKFAVFAVNKLIDEARSTHR